MMGQVFDKYDIRELGDEQPPAEQEECPLCAYAEGKNDNFCPLHGNRQYPGTVSKLKPKTTPAIEVSGILRWLPGNVGSTGDEAWFIESKPDVAVKLSTALGFDYEKDDGHIVTLTLKRERVG